MSSPARPHFAFPFTRTSTGVQTVEQKSEEHIMAQANVVARCPLGYREERPEFGWSWPDLELMPIDATPLLNALTTFVPDGTFTLADAQQIAAGTFDLNIDVGVASADQTGVSQGND